MGSSSCLIPSPGLMGQRNSVRANRTAGGGVWPLDRLVCIRRQQRRGGGVGGEKVVFYLQEFPESSNPGRGSPSLI